MTMDTFHPEDKVDHEVTELHSIVAAFERLAAEAKQRTLSYLNHRYATDDQKATGRRGK